MPHVISSSQKVSSDLGLADSAAVWETPIEGSITVKNGTEISCLSAYVSKPGADRLRELNTIELESDVNIEMNPCVGAFYTEMSGSADGLDPIDIANFPDPSTEQVPWLLRSTGAGTPLVRLKIRIQIPAGVYMPGEIAAIISDQTRNVDVVWSGGNTEGQVYGPTYISTEDTSGNAYTPDISGGAWTLKKHGGANHEAFVPDFLGGTYRQSFGSQQGISVVYDATRNQFQMSATHTPLFDSNGQIIMMFKISAGSTSAGIFYGVGWGGAVFFDSGSWGYPDETSWNAGIWKKLGFSWADLNSGRFGTPYWYTNAQVQLGMGTKSFSGYSDGHSVQSDRTNGIYSVTVGTSIVPSTPLWWLECQLLPTAGSWRDESGRVLSKVIATVDKTFSSGDFYSQTTSPTWVVSVDSDEVVTGSLRIRIINPTTKKPDDSLGEGSYVLLQISDGV